MSSKKVYVNLDNIALHTCMHQNCNDVFLQHCGVARRIVCESEKQRIFSTVRKLLCLSDCNLVVRKLSDNRGILVSPFWAKTTQVALKPAYAVNCVLDVMQFGFQALTVQCQISFMVGKKLCFQ